MMPAVRKTTNFTDGALFSFLSHPLFLVPLPIPSTGSDSRQRHSFFGSKVCIANMHPTITRKTMQRHRVLAAKGCIANRKPAITGKICNDTGYSPQKSVSRTGKPALPAKFCSDTGFSAQKSVSRAAALSFRFERVYRGQCGFKTVYRVRRRWT